jgi:hypothetical protein
MDSSLKSRFYPTVGLTTTSPVEPTKIRTRSNLKSKVTALPSGMMTTCVRHGSSFSITALASVPGFPTSSGHDVLTTSHGAGISQDAHLMAIVLHSKIPPVQEHWVLVNAGPLQQLTVPYPQTAVSGRYAGHVSPDWGNVAGHRASLLASGGSSTTTGGTVVGQLGVKHASVKKQPKTSPAEHWQTRESNVFPQQDSVPYVHLRSLEHTASLPMGSLSGQTSVVVGVGVGAQIPGQSARGSQLSVGSGSMHVCPSGQGARPRLPQICSATQIPPQSAPPCFGSQVSLGSSMQEKPDGHRIPAKPPQNAGAAAGAAC